MKNLNPDQIFNAFKNSEIDKPSTIQQLISSIEKLGDIHQKKNAIKLLASSELRAVDELLALYRTLESNGDGISNELMQMMENIVGKHYVKNSGLVHRDAMGMGLLELIIGKEILDGRKIHPSTHESSFCVKDKSITYLKLVDIDCQETNFLYLLPHLEWLEINGDHLRYISEIGRLNKLKYLRLSGPFEELQGLEKLESLQSLIIDVALISKLDGIEKLNFFLDLWLDDTNVPESEEKKYQEIIEKNKKNLIDKKEELIYLGKKNHTQGKLNEAIKAFEQAQNVSSKLWFHDQRPYNFLTHDEWHELAKMYVKIKDYEKALDACDQGIKVDSRPKEIRDLRKEIINLMKIKS